MADLESSPPKAEAEVITGGGVEEEKTEAEAATPLVPLVKEVTETAKAAVEDVKVNLSSDEVEKEVEKLVVESDLPVSLNRLESTAESLINGNENPLTTSDKSVGESSEEVKFTVSSEVEKVVEKLVSDSSASLKNLESAAESWIKGSANILANSLGAVKESSDAVKLTDAEPEKTVSDETTRNRDIQVQKIELSARASWTNCCGLLDLLAHNH